MTPRTVPGAPDLGPLPQRVTVEAEQVRRLVQSQFPQFADLPVEPVTNGGWDNRTFHLGPEMLLRLPSAAEYALAVEKEHRWLPVLAAELPLPIPVPVAKAGSRRDVPVEGREAFRERLAVDDATWARGRGWALWKALGESERVLGEIFSEYATGRSS